jgi:hypothetical protein
MTMGEGLQRACSNWKVTMHGGAGNDSIVVQGAAVREIMLFKPQTATGEHLRVACSRMSASISGNSSCEGQVMRAGCLQPACPWGQW